MNDSLEKMNDSLEKMPEDARLELAITVHNQWLEYAEKMHKLTSEMQLFARQNNDIASILNFGILCIVTSIDFDKKTREKIEYSPDMCSVMCSSLTAEKLKQHAEILLKVEEE